jgi:PAS domain S-box-containing protein
MENARVLIIEDNPVDTLCLKDALKESKTINFVISHVETLAEGKESLANADFHVVALDLGLPDSQGLETFFRIQNSAPTTSIVVLSGLDDEILAREAVRKGAQDYLLKGKYDGHLLSRSITYAIERKRAQEEIRRLNEDLEMRIKERTRELATANEKLLLEITNRKKAEESALESKAKLEAALASMTDAVFISDVEGNFIDFNEAFATFHKFRNKEECARKLAEYPLFLDVYMANGELAPFEQWAVSRALRGETATDAEYTLRRKDTGETWIGSYSFAPICGPKGQLVGSVVVGRDITEKKRAEEALRRSEERLRLAQEAAQAGTWEWDLRTNKNFWSDELWALYGLGPHSCEPSYDGWLASVHPDDRADAEQAVKEAASNSAELNAEWRTNNGTGQRWLMSRGRPLRDATGKVSSYIGIVVDITDLKRAEQLIRESEKNHRLLIENLNSGVVVHAPDTSVLLANLVASRLLGLTPDEMTGKKASDPAWRFVREDGSPLPPEEYPVNRVLSSLGPLSNIVVGITTPGASGPIWALANAYPAFNEKNELEQIVVTFVDITDRKHAEDELTRSKEELRLTLEATTNGIWKHNLKTNEGEFSPKYYTMLGYEPNEFPATRESWVDLIHPEDRPKALQTANQYLEKKLDLYENEFRLRTKSGDYRWIRSLARPAETDSQGKLVRLIGSHEDITARKLIEEKLEAEKAKFKAILDHMNDGVYIVNDQYEIQYINPVIEAQFGPVNGKKCYEYFHDRIETCPWCKNAEIWAGKSVQWEWLSTKAGKTYELFDTPIKNEDGSISKLEIFHDITERKKAVEALRQSEMEKSLILESAAEMFIYYDLDLRVRWANKASADSVGQKPEALIGRHCYEIWQGRQTPCEDCPVILARNTGLPQQAEQVTPDGRIWAIRGYPVKDDGGGTVGLIEFIQDITEQKNAERALQESEQRYRAMFNIASVGIDLVDDEGRFLEANSALCQILGYTQEELRQLTILDVTHPEDVNRSREMHEAMVRGEMDGYRLEKRYVRKDGAIVWSDTAASTIRDADARYGATVGVIRDITQSKKSKEVRIRLAAAVEQAGETIVITDIDGTILYANPAFERTTGYTPEEALGKSPRILKSGRQDEVFYKDLWDTILGGKVWTGRFINKKKDGSLYEEDASISPVKADSGEIVNYVAVKRDVTGEVSLQKQLLQAQKMEAIGTLAGGVAHDFNNILQVALGYSELMLGDEEFPRNYREDLRKIQESAHRGADLVQRLLTFSRKTEIKLQPLNLNTRITELRKMLERTLPKMVDIQLVLDVKLAKINADKTQIDQVLMNLAVNARDAMPEGGKLVIETANVSLDEEYAVTHLDAYPGSYVRLTITDTGSGIDTEIREHIFEPFYTTKGVGVGTGLGLAMVHGIVKHHGGHIRCYSEPGEGTSFAIYFPALILEDQEGETIERPMPQGGSETILLVDDEEFIRDLGSRILRRAGYKVITASNGKQALEVYQVRGDEISLIVLDLIMPEMGGKQCLGEILRVDPSAKAVIASGFSANGRTKDALAAGAKGFVNKPYDIRQLLEVIREVLDQA